MRRQRVKGLTMLGLLLTLALATTAITAKGQEPRVSAHVPFDFIVGDKVLAAGDYKLNEIATGSGFVAIQGSKQRAVRSTNVMNWQTNKRALVFHRYGDTYFLAEIWGGPDGINRQLLKSRQERALQKEAARIARNGTPLYEEIVLIAAQ
jgi:hypothetical protein